MTEVTLRSCYDDFVAGRIVSAWGEGYFGGIINWWWDFGRGLLVVSWGILVVGFFLGWVY